MGLGRKDDFTVIDYGAGTYEQVAAKSGGVFSIFSTGLILKVIASAYAAMN